MKMCIVTFGLSCLIQTVGTMTVLTAYERDTTCSLLGASACPGDCRRCSFYDRDGGWSRAVWEADMDRVFSTLPADGGDRLNSWLADVELHLDRPELRIQPVGDGDMRRALMTDIELLADAQIATLLGHATQKNMWLVCGRHSNRVTGYNVGVGKVDFNICPIPELMGQYVVSSHFSTRMCGVL